MSVKINASTTSGLVVDSDLTGSLRLQTGGNDALTVDSSQVVNFTKQFQIGGVLPPAFSAYKNDGQQSVTSATFTKLTFSAELFDTNNNFASSRFTPTVAGYYQLNAGASSFGGNTATRMLVTIYQNGASLFTLYDVANSAPGRGSGGVLVYANGTTDYFEVYGYLTTGSGLAFETGYGGAGYQTWFNGCLVRAA